MILRLPPQPTLRIFGARILQPLALLTLLAGPLAGCTDHAGQAWPAITSQPERAPATTADRTPPLQRTIPLSENPDTDTLLALVLLDMMPDVRASGALPGIVERARGEVPNMARPLTYSITEPLSLDADGRILSGSLEVIDETDFASRGYFVFTFHLDGRITLQDVNGDLPSLQWEGVVRRLGGPSARAYPLPIRCATCRPA